MREKIISIIRSQGPSLPVEVSSKVGSNSFLTKAYLDELVETGVLRKSQKKVGESFIYFAPGQESAVEAKISGLSAKKTARIYADKKVNVTPELAKKREEFDNRLKRIETEEARIKTIKLAPQPPIQPRVQIKIARSEIPLPTPEAKKKEILLIEPDINEEDRDNFIERAINLLVRNKIEILEKEEKSRSADLLVNVPSAVGAVKFLIRIRNKRKISKSELVELYAEALEQRTPVLLLTNAELADTSKKYLETVGGFLRIKLL